MNDVEAVLYSKVVKLSLYFTITNILLIENIFLFTYFFNKITISINNLTANLSNYTFSFIKKLYYKLHLKL